MLYCNTATVATTWGAGAGLGPGWVGAGCAARLAGRARSAQADVRGARAGAAGNWARGRGAQRAQGREEQARGAGGRQALGSWGTRSLGAGRAGCALGALRLVFNLVFRLGIFPESLNEHCPL